MINAEALKERVNNLHIWKRRDERAPHKPLLILLALGYLSKNHPRLLSYSELRESLKNLIIEFGPRRQNYYPSEPFTRLRNDGIWTLSADLNEVNTTDRWLLEHDIKGGFNEEVYSLLVTQKELLREVAEIVLMNHFPASIHEDILAAVGLDFEKGLKIRENQKPYSSRSRDPRFREIVLRAYEQSCAVCGFNIRLGSSLVAVDAAHIKWHQAGGPDREDNGIALCSLHHKLFDRGVYTLTPDNTLVVAEDAYGSTGFEDWLMRYHGKQIRRPIRPEYKPNDSFVDWHMREVFKGPARV